MKSEEQIRERIEKISNLKGYYSKKNDKHQIFARRLQIEELLWVLNDDEIEKK